MTLAFWLIKRCGAAIVQAPLDQGHQAKQNVARCEPLNGGWNVLSLAGASEALSIRTDIYWDTTDIVADLPWKKGAHQHGKASKKQREETDQQKM